MDFFLEIAPYSPSPEHCDAATTLERMYRRWIEPSNYQIIYCDNSEYGISRCIAKVASDRNLSSESGFHTIKGLSPFRSDLKIYESSVLVEMIPVKESCSNYTILPRRRGAADPEVTVSKGLREITTSGPDPEENKKLAVSYLASTDKYTPKTRTVRQYCLQPPKVTDFRLNATYSDVGAVLDGDLDRFFRKRKNIS